MAVVVPLVGPRVERPTALLEAAHPVGRGGEVGPPVELVRDRHKKAIHQKQGPKDPAGRALEAGARMTRHTQQHE